jgi:hypothetical protein
MVKSNLSKKQLAAVIGELVAGKLDEQAIADKHQVSRRTFYRWLSDEAFIAELDRRIEWLNRRGELMLARKRSEAVSNLAKLTKNETAETARKACLDIINFSPQQQPNKDQSPQLTQPSDQHQTLTLAPQTATKLLATLAEEEAEKT